MIKKKEVCQKVNFTEGKIVLKTQKLDELCSLTARKTLYS